MRKALILVDYQNEWRDRKSEYYLGNLRTCIAAAKRIAEEARRKGITVIYTRHIEPSPTKAFKRGSRNSEIVGELSPGRSDFVITKSRISPFYRTRLEALLKRRGIKSIAVAGIMTNLCVRSTVSDAYDRDMEVTLVRDACSSGSKKTDSFTFKDIKSTRPEVKIVSSTSFIRSL